MQKRFMCWTCYQAHPERKGVSEQEFKNGKNVCDDGKCSFRGKTLEEVELCEKCDKLFKPGTHKAH